MTAATWFLITTLATTVGLRASIPPPPSSSPPNSATSIAVLVRSTDASSKYIAADYARALIHLLGGAEPLTIAPRSRVLQAEGTAVAPAELGRAIGAKHMLSATVNLAGEALEISVELTDAATETQRWKNTYRSSLASAAHLAAKIVHDALRVLDVAPGKAKTRERDVVTASSAAWGHYLRGRQALNTFGEPSFVEAIAYFRSAVSADPEFAAAHGALATAHLALGYNFQQPRAQFEKARASLAKTGRSAAPLAEAVIADAVLKYYLEWDWNAAVRGAAFATQHDPSAVDTHACFLHCAQTIGRIEEGRYASLLRTLKLAAR